MAFLFTVILIALIFEYINGFHDTANSIATVVSTKVLTPRMAIVLAAVTNLLGALWGTAVAKTISKGLVDAAFVNQQTIACALLGGIVWNLITWYFGLPSSSSHAMVGGLCGATLANAAEAVSAGKLDSVWSSLIWAKLKDGDPWFKGEGLLYKVVIPMVTSPVLGFIIGVLLMGALYILLRRWRPVTVSRVFGRLQLGSAAYMGFSHGTNDAQKTMGIIALALVAANQEGVLAGASSWFDFLHHPMVKGADGKEGIAVWIKVICAITMAAGTAAGGWRIIKTMGHKMVKLQPVHGFAAETTAATVLATAAHFGLPVSTTHAISTSIMGVGAAKRFSSLKFSVVERILWAWVLTLPAAAGAAYLFNKVWISLAR
jgi:PiT family inorganic phosphate transporter